MCAPRTYQTIYLLTELFVYFIFCDSDGYTMSDVLMYWQPTPVLGVFDTELPQFTILGFETNDRQVRTISFCEAKCTVQDSCLFFHRNNWQRERINGCHCRSNSVGILAILCFKLICRAF